MSNFAGFVSSGLQLGLQTITIRPQRGFANIVLDDGSTLAPFEAQATIEEHHLDELEVTDHPVEIGAPITDHAYKRPAELTLHLGWSNSPSTSSGLIGSALAVAATQNPTIAKAATAVSIAGSLGNLGSTLNGADISQIQAIYRSLLALQSNRALFDVFTGKRQYIGMVCRSLRTETSAQTATSLPITMLCKQIILVNTQLLAIPAANCSNPAANASPVNKGTQTLIPKVSVPGY